MPINIPRYVSPLQAIRSALGDLGFGSLMQTLEPDLIRWAIEAQDLISKKKTFIYSEPTNYTVENNKIALCADALMIESVCMGGRPLTYNPTLSCGGMCTDNCKSMCVGNAQEFYVDECYVHFNPPVADGTPIEMVTMERPMGDDGYPLVIDSCMLAVAEYEKWKICFRQKDERYKECEQRWYVLCRQARAELNKYSQKQIENLGKIWSGA